MSETTRDQESAERRLQDLGFTEYESRAYAALLRAGPLTGYQLAKESGVPRPNIYSVLERLERRGVVIRVKTGEGSTYAAQPATEMVNTLSRSFQRRLDEAGVALSRLAEEAPGEHVWNIEGYEAVLMAAADLVDGADNELVAGMWSPEARRLTDAFSRAESRGVDVTTLCLQGCADECGGCHGDLYRYPAPTTPKDRWFVLTADGERLIVAQTRADGQTAAAVTRLPALVTVGAQYLRNAIATAELMRSVPPALLRSFDERALRALRRAGVRPGEKA